MNKWMIKLTACVWLLVAGFVLADDSVGAGYDSSAVIDGSTVEYPVHDLPEGLEWLTNLDDPALGDPNAKRGGRYTTFMLSYPVTFRTVGPDSNGGFRSNLLNNQMGLVDFHPTTNLITPELATHWAFGDDGRTIYYKLDERARWSDGIGVTADDFLFQWDFMRSEHIVAPWYNKHYGTEIVSVKKYDDYTISITGASVKPGDDLFYYYSITPRPRHFHVLDRDWVRAYNWKIEPNTGPYQVKRFRNGKFIEFERKQDWWANDHRYFKHRYNVQTVRFQVIRDINIAFKYFEKGYIDSFPLILPDHWINKTKRPVFERGLTQKLTFFTDTHQPMSAMYMNQAKPLFKDKNVRLGLAHSINYDKVIKGILNGDYARLPSLFTGYGDYSNKSLSARPFDLALAKEYFAKAGFKNRNGQGILENEKGEPLSFKLLYTAEIHTPRLLILKEEAKKAGVDMVLQRMDGSTMFKSILEKQHDVGWLGFGGGFRPQFWGSWHSDNANKPQTNNITNTANPKLDLMIDAYKESTVHEERAQLARDIAQLIHDEAYVIPRTYVPFIRYGYWRWLQLPEYVSVPETGDVFDPFGSTGGFFWIDETMKEETQTAKKGDRTFPIQPIYHDDYARKTPEVANDE